MRFSGRPATIAAIAALALTSCGTGAPEDGGTITLTIAANAISGGKNSESADWIKGWVIPEFQKTHQNVKVLFQPSGVDDEQYMTKIALGLKSKTGADIIDLDGIWVGEFAQAGYIRPLTDVGGAVRVLNPFSGNPRPAWELPAFLHSAEATKSQLAGRGRISSRSRTDINDEVPAGDPMLRHIADEVLPITAYRPGLAVYPQVSVLLLEATAEVVPLVWPGLATIAVWALASV